jgi:hypothetical protein
VPPCVAGACHTEAGSRPDNHWRERWPDLRAGESWRRAPLRCAGFKWTACQMQMAQFPCVKVFSKIVNTTNIIAAPAIIYWARDLFSLKIVIRQQISLWPKRLPCYEYAPRANPLHGHCGKASALAGAGFAPSLPPAVHRQPSPGDVLFGLAFAKRACNRNLDDFLSFKGSILRVITNFKVQQTALVAKF